MLYFSDARRSQRPGRARLKASSGKPRGASPRGARPCCCGRRAGWMRGSSRLRVAAARRTGRRGGQGEEGAVGWGGSWAGDAWGAGERRGRGRGLGRRRGGVMRGLAVGQTDGRCEVLVARETRAAGGEELRGAWGGGLVYGGLGRAWWTWAGGSGSVGRAGAVVGVGGAWRSRAGMALLPVSARGKVPRATMGEAVRLDRPVYSVFQRERRPGESAAADAFALPPIRRSSSRTGGVAKAASLRPAA